jgi:fucose permease
MTETIKKTRREASVRVQLGLAFLSFILLGASDGSVGVLIPSVQTNYHVDKAVVSLIFLCSTFGYLVSAMNSGFLVSKLGKRNYLLLGVGAFMVSALILSLRPPFPVFACMLFPIGFGGAVIDSGMNSHVAVLPRGTEILNYLHAFYGIGALLGPLVATSIIVSGLLWNHTYLVWMCLSILVFVGFMLVFAGKNEKPIEEHHRGGGVSLASIVKFRLVWFLAFFLLFYVGIEVGLGSWIYSFLTEDRRFITLYSGWVVSGYWLGLTLGRVALGRVALRFGERLTIRWCVFGVAFGILLTWLVPAFAVNAVGLCFVGFCLGPIFPTVISLTSKNIATRSLTTAIGFIISLASAGGALLPWTAGNLAQYLGIWSIMPYFIILTVGMLVLWFVIQVMLRRGKVVAA